MSSSGNLGHSNALKSSSIFLKMSFHMNFEIPLHDETQIARCARKRAVL